MSEYGLSLDEALDITDDQAVVLLKAATRRRFIDQLNLATLIIVKLGEGFSGKKSKIKIPYEDELKKDEITTPLTEGGLKKLMSL
jgi:hypothetical protein